MRPEVGVREPEAEAKALVSLLYVVVRKQSLVRCRISMHPELLSHLSVACLSS